MPSQTAESSASSEAPPDPLYGPTWMFDKFHQPPVVWLMRRASIQEIDMSFPCAVSIDLNRHERHIDALEKRDAYLSKARETFVENRVEDMMQNPSMILQFLGNIPTRYDLVLGIAIRDAIAQSGKCWDGVHALERLLKEQARDEALHEWERKEPLMDDDGSADFHEDERE